MITVEDSRFMVEDYVMVMTMSSSLITFKMKQKIIINNFCFTQI